LSKDDEIGVLDTSALLEIKDSIPKADRPALFKRLDKAVADGRIVYPVHVVEELERWVQLPKAPPDPILAWATKNRAQADGHGRLFNESKAVLALVPKVLDPHKPSGVEEADPFVLGLAYRLDKEGKLCTVITQERKDRPDKMSMNTACGILRLPCLPMLAFLEAEGLWVP
jgi:hypothetical protein